MGEHSLCSKGKRLNAKQALWMRHGEGSWKAWLHKSLFHQRALKLPWGKILPLLAWVQQACAPYDLSKAACISSMLPFSHSSTLFPLFSFISFPFLHLFPTTLLSHQVKMSLYKTHWDAIMFTSDLFLRLFSSLVPLNLYKLAILVHESFYDKSGTALVRWQSHISGGFPQAPKCKAALESSHFWLIFSYLMWNPKMSKLMGITLKAFLMKIEHDFCQKAEPAFHWKAF